MSRTTHRVRPSPGPVEGSIRPPGSKSITIRALAAAALAGGRSHIRGALDADDTRAMAGALDQFGVTVERGPDAWIVEGNDGPLAPGGNRVDTAESGLTTRICIAMAALAEGRTTFVGRGRLNERPMSGVVEALRSQGVEVETEEGHLPITVVGAGYLPGGKVEVDCSDSSQFATALLHVAPRAESPSIILPRGLAGSRGYVAMTVEVITAFGGSIHTVADGWSVANGGFRATHYHVEPDASAAVYPMVAAAITGGRIEILGIGSGSSQPDVTVARRLRDMGCVVEARPSSLVIDASTVELEGIDADMSEAPDGALALAVACLFARTPSRISGLTSLRLKESDRLAALVAEISRIGGLARVEGDTLEVTPGPLHPATIDPHGDHRMAMAMALVGLRVPGVEVADPGVVDKTWPGYWSALESLIL